MKLSVCFLWHMHQPYYRDPETGTYILPWVRLHAIKDYAALPRMFRAHRGVRHTFNLVPSLLIQVVDYVEKGAEDVFLTLSRKNALDLSRDEEGFLIRNFFSAFPPTMIFPQPRYADLFNRREAALHAVGKPGGYGGFGATEYTDLVVLFNLTWIHPLHRREDKELDRLWRKGSGYTEREKRYVLDRQIEIMASVIPEYRKLLEEDGGELSSTPMYHPILPLLVDNNAAHDALPGAPLPKTLFSYPLDAVEQLRRGRESFRSFFGRYPDGLWPSEGSISPAAVELAAQAGFRWAATDEILLSKSLGKTVARDAEGIPVNPSWLYRPYRAPTTTGDISVFFRDHHLSDLIGFEYSRWDAGDAVSNFIHKLQRIWERLSSIPSGLGCDSYVIPVILDGENAWEYYPDHAEHFLDQFLGRLSALSSEISFVTFSEALDRSGEVDVLPSIPTGSWIDGTFGIWIGHPEDHAAWEMLARARGLFQLHSERMRRSGRESSDSLKAAYEHLLVAEGSDWCWWYGDDHFTPHGPEYDRLFRHHVKAAYRQMGEIPPDSLDIPIIEAERLPVGTGFLESPRHYVHPKIDGIVSSYFEWSSATRYVPSPELGAMHRAGHGLLSSFYFGFDESNVFFRADFHPSIFELPVPVQFDLVFVKKNRKISVILYPDNRSIRTYFGEIERHLIDQNALAGPDVVSAAFAKVLELGIPFVELGCVGDERLEFFIGVHPEGSLGERWPMYGNFTAELPGADFAEKMWEV